ncbi:MAG: PIN domain-containing protein [Burkholderiales bacterium]|jgi:toxin-antitoxin system PIN domain toxin|nr:PIN domain-containing protein [Burkholderiales bacterium]
MSCLLDANALIALLWPAHEHHAVMRRWFRNHAEQGGWTTCALTQAAVIRIVSQPSFAGRPMAISDVARLLLANTAHPMHSFVALDFDFGTVLSTCTGGLQGHRQVTDAYLLTAAIRHGLRLLTFDSGLSSLLATPGERERHVWRLMAA